MSLGSFWSPTERVGSLTHRRQHLSLQGSELAPGGTGARSTRSVNTRGRAVCAFDFQRHGNGPGHRHVPGIRLGSKKHLWPRTCLPHVKAAS